MHCVYDILEQTDYHRYRLEMFMNFRDFSDYLNCETSYWGTIEHYDKRLKEDAALAEQLKITKEDIRLFKLYNMYPVM